MRLRSRLGRGVVGLTLLGGVAGVALPPVDASDRLATGRPIYLTVELASPDPGEVTALASQSGIAPADRAARLRAAMPTSQVRSAVERRLRSAGLQVTGTTKFSVEASGSGKAAPPGFPASLVAGVVTSRLPSLSLKPHADPFSPTSTTGASIGRIDDTSRPTADDPVDTIATLQYSGWDESNLAKFAAIHHLPNPVTSGQYTQVSVNHDSVTKDNGGSDEVALDEESLLETSPHSNLRAYFVGESTEDTVDALNQIASDAAADHIVAMSDSWGNCEPEVSGAQLRAVNAAIKNLVAAGVTVFSGSGDAGAYDCSTPGQPDDELAVDFPPSDPYVIAVGGTTVDAHNIAAPVQHTWWTASGRRAPKYLGQGTGGGISSKFAKPTYQAHVATSALNRVVPDISLEADPDSGFAITNDGVTEGGNGGTSLSGPLAAATLADTLEVNRVGGGIGNILPAMYDAPASDFSDVTVGTNGHYKARSGYDLATGLGAPLWDKLAPKLLSFSAAVPAVANSDNVDVTVSVADAADYTSWYDGVGSPPTVCPLVAGAPSPPTTVAVMGDGTQEIWVLGETAAGCTVAAGLTSVDTSVPVVHVAAHLTSRRRHLVTATWSASDAAPSTGIDHYSVVVSRSNGSDAFYRRSATAAKKVTFVGIGRRAYRVTVRAVDKAGNASVPVSVTIRS